MLKIGQTGWIEKEVPACGPLDAICRPLALALMKDKPRDLIKPLVIL